MTQRTKLTIGTRSSQLALWQSNWVKSELEKKYPKLQIELIEIKTKGDKIFDSSLSKIGDKGLFTKEIEHALLEHRIDLAVHSLKDMPTQLPDRLTIGAVTKREDVHDVFVSHSKKAHKHFEELPRSATVATGSLRRKCQLLNWRPDITIVDLRGNIETRLSKLDASDWDGMILARAGLVRLGLQGRITEVLPIDKMLPAVGQGALAIEIRDNDEQVLQYIKHLTHIPTKIVTRGERALFHHLEGGCQIPIGCYGHIENNELIVSAMIGSLDGKQMVRGKIHGIPEQAEELGKQLAQTLFESGGKEILEQIRDKAPVGVPAV